MTKLSAMLLGAVGALAVVASIYGSIAPPAFFGSKGLLFCGVLFLVGAVLVISAIALYQKSKISTVRVAMGDEAEEDAASLTKIEYSVSRGENAEKHVPEQKKEKLVVPPEVFSTLSKDMTNYSKAAKKEKPAKKTKPAKITLSPEILKVAKRAKKKKK